MQKPEDDFTPKPLPGLLPEEEPGRSQMGYRGEDLWVLAGLETGPRRPDLHWAAPPAEQSPTGTERADQTEIPLHHTDITKRSQEDHKNITV